MCICLWLWWKGFKNKFFCLKSNCFFLFFLKISTDRYLERGKESGRSDDNEESLKKTVNLFLNL